jgi:hypothetical protein
VKVLVYPADKYGCGHFRMIWPGEELKKDGHDVEIITAQNRHVTIHLEGETVVDADIEADVVVFQRLTHKYLAQVVPILRKKGVAVVIDIDDDLNAIDPNNPAWGLVHPKDTGSPHSWRNLNQACRDATLVTVSTPALLDVYAKHGRGHLLPNYLPDVYDDIPHEDSDVIGWPASYHSHPSDPNVVGGAVSRLVSEGYAFRMVGDASGAGKAFSLPEDPPGKPCSVHEWPNAVASLGIGIAPLADTRFNRSKSWLKPLEMCAAGVPWVASPRAEYERLHALGAGLTAERPRVWYRLLRQLAESSQRRTELSESGRAVARSLRLADHAWKWLEAWERAYKLER